MGWGERTEPGPADEQRVVVELTEAHIVGPDDRVILQCSDPNVPLDVVMGMQQALNDVFGPNRALVVMGDAMTVLVQRQPKHDVVSPFSLHTLEGEQIGEHDG